MVAASIQMNGSEAECKEYSYCEAAGLRGNLLRRLADYTVALIRGGHKRHSADVQQASWDSSEYLVSTQET